MKPNDSADKSTEQLSFEEALAKLENIVHDLEEGQIGLEDALLGYERGVKILKRCHSLLDCAERKIELLSGVDAAGNLVTQPFDDQATIAQPDTGRSRSKRQPTKPPDQPAAPVTTEDDDGMDARRTLF